MPLRLWIASCLSARLAKSLFLRLWVRSSQLSQGSAHFFGCAGPAPWQGTDRPVRVFGKVLHTHTCVHMSTHARTRARTCTMCRCAPGIRHAGQAVLGR